MAEMNIKQIIDRLNAEFTGVSGKYYELGNMEFLNTI